MGVDSTSVEFANCLKRKGEVDLTDVSQLPIRNFHGHCKCLKCMEKS
jgi:hypothetical protein